MKDESSTLDKVNKIPSLETADSAILSNLYLQGALFVAVLLVYIYLRPRVGWLYYPNPRGRPNHPCYGYTGYFSWIIPILTTSDTVMLSLVGLDAFMMIQTLKLMLKIITVLILMFLPVLSYVYWNYSTNVPDKGHQYLTRLSIGNIDTKSNFYYAVPISLYLISFIIYYFVFIYYKKYTILRQLFLRDPSTMSSIITLKKLSKALGSAEESVNYFSLPNRTVLVTRLPSFVRTDEDLKDFFIYLNVGDIEDTVIIHDTTYLQELYSRKNECIENIEKEINSTLNKMNKYSKKHKEECVDSIEGFKDSLKLTVENQTEQEQIDVAQKIKILKEFIDTDDKFKTKYKGTMKAIDLYFSELGEIYKKINDEKENIKEMYTRMEDVNIGEEISRHNSLFIPGDEENVTFFSISQFLDYRKNRDFLSLDLPFNTRKGFVIFKNFVDANVVKNSQLGSRIFTVTAETAPSPNDVMWENITKGVVSNQFYKVFGDIAFVIFNIAFTFIVVYVIQVLDTDRFDDNGYFLRLLSKYETVKSMYEGFVPPVVYALLLLFVPTFITILVNLEGVHSYSMFQRVLMEKFVNFLFFNSLISFFFASTLFSQIADIYSNDTTPSQFIEQFGAKILKSSVFFFNTVVQKGLFGTAMFMLKPGPLIVNYLLVNIFPKKTPREVEQSEFCPPFDFGSLFPSILIVFPMTLVYAIIAPSILIPGFIFFFFNFYAIKSEFLYSTRTEYESGGVFWETSARIIIYSVLFFQIATTAKMFADGAKLSCLAVLPLFWISWNFKNTIAKLFSKCCNSYPLNIKEEKYLDEFTHKLNSDRMELLNSWTEEEDKEIIDKIEVSDLGFQDKEEVSKKSYYRDPSTTSSISDFRLPDRFFNFISFLKKSDKNNIFGYKDGESKRTEESKSL